MKKLLPILLCLSIFAGLITFSVAGQYDAYKPDYRQPRWDVKINAFIDQVSALYAYVHDTLGVAVTALNTLVTNWATTENYLIYCAATPTYSDGDTFTVPGDLTASFPAGRVIQADNGADGVKVTTVASSSYAGGNTTVDLSASVLTANLARIFFVASRDGLTVSQSGHVFASDYGSPGLTALNNAIAAIGASNRVLVVGPGTWSLNDDVTVPANVCLAPMQGAVFEIADTKVLTVNGPFQAGLYRVFDDQNTDYDGVVFGVGAVKEVCPEWWGALADNLTDSTSAIQSAILAGGVRCKVALSSGTYLISSKLIEGSSLVGVGPEKTIIKATPTFSDTMMYDKWNPSGYLQNLRISDLTFDANHVSGVSIFGSSHELTNGNPIGYYSNVIFCNVTDTYAINATGINNVAGMMTGATLVNCRFYANHGDIYLAANQDDVAFLNCRFDWQGNSGRNAIYITAANCKFIGGFGYFKNLYEAGGVRTIFSVDASSFLLDGFFFESTTGTNITHLFRLGGVTWNHDIKNLYLHIEDAASYVGIARMTLWGWAGSTRKPSLNISGVSWWGNVPLTNYVLDAYASDETSYEYMNLHVSRLTNYDLPVVKLTGGAFDKVAVIISGEVNGKRINHAINTNTGYFGESNAVSEIGYGAVIDNSDPVLGKVKYQGQIGIPSHQETVNTASAASGVTAQFTLPKEGCWLVHITGKMLDANENHMASSVWLVDFNNGATNDLLAYQQLGVTKKCGSATDIVITSGPTDAGVVTMTATWSGGGSYITRAIVKAKLLSNFEAHNN